MSVIPQRPQTRAAGRLARLGGAEGNESLTIATASILTLLLIAEGYTVLNVGGLLTAHMFIGLILIPPLLVKIGSTGYRMVRYYANTPEYRRKGAPLLPLRLLAPVLVVATIGIFASGVALMASGHKSDLLLNVHKVSFIVWGVVFVVHFLSYLPRVLRAVGQTASGQGRKVPGAELRAMLLAAGVGSGVALALILLPVITGWSE